MPPAAPATRPFEQTVDVETPELVVLTYSVAGVGSRVLAAFTDLVICLAAMVGLVLAFAFLLGVTHTSGPNIANSWAMGIFILAQFGVIWGYYVLFEGLRDGQTPGKRIHRLRVVQEGGYSVTFGVSAARNLVRVLDMQPAIFYLVGIGTMLASKRGRRLGDIVAGTIVVREDVRAAALATPAAPRRDVGS